jgi:hypothetical protein
MFVWRRAVFSDDVSDEVPVQGSCSTATASAIASQIGHVQLEMKKNGASSCSSLLVARSSSSLLVAPSEPPPHTCTLCQREFKSQHAGSASFPSLFSFVFIATQVALACFFFIASLLLLLCFIASSFLLHCFILPSPTAVGALS